MISSKILVIGSSNTDMIVRTERQPLPGETILGGCFVMDMGGKGANQAVAAKRLGGNVSFICKIGNDTFGDNALNHYEKEGLDVSRSIRCATHSGVALITIDKNAENSIVVASGANLEMSPADIEACADVIRSAGILLMQLEIPVETVLKAAQIAHKAGVYVILNPAPACDLPNELYSNISMLIPNQTEIQLLTGHNADSDEGFEAAVQTLFGRGVKDLILTRGSKGCSVVQNGDFSTRKDYPACKVEAVDTTGAGDTFCGALCVALSESKSIEEAVLFATKASSLTVQKIGTQDSIPCRADVNC